MEMIVVKSKLKEVANGCNVSGDFAEALNKVAHEQVKHAIKRAQANNRKTIGPKDVYLGKTSSKTMLLVKSKVKDATGGKVSVSGDFAEALNEVLVWLVQQAAERAQANGRKTVGAKDL